MTKTKEYCHELHVDTDDAHEFFLKERRLQRELYHRYKQPGNTVTYDTHTDTELTFCALNEDDVVITRIITITVTEDE